MIGRHAIIDRDHLEAAIAETPEEVAAVITDAMRYVAKEKIIACTNCGMVPMQWDVAYAKLTALRRGAELARQKLG